MKRVPKVFILGAAVFALCALTPAGFATAAKISVSSTTASPGEQAIIPVYLSDNDIDIMALTVPLKYSSTDLRVDSVSFAGTLLRYNMAALVHIDNSERFVRFTYSPTTSMPIISDEGGLLARIFFSVDDNASEQAAEIDSVNRLESSGPPEFWTRLEIADASGLVLYFPEFAPGTLSVQTPTAVDDSWSGLPTELALRQNYPNPFNPSTIIAYSLPERAHVTLKVFNILGQEVETLVDEVRNAGIHEERWDAADQATGIYFYRLAYRDKVLTKKMALLK